MITKEMIDRINHLAKKSRQDGLTEEETLEQQELRKKYIEYIKGQVRNQLDSIKFVEDGHDCGNEHHDGNCGCKKH
ncbi:MAG: hypothetical protein APF77_23175 [Clostridia bacterium BRH_c25]|nr:MAG: hypothetical protein APF77_23175 [Clostridia bacterium BRH_c25]